MPHFNPPYTNFSFLKICKKDAREVIWKYSIDKVIKQGGLVLILAFGEEGYKRYQTFGSPALSFISQELQNSSLNVVETLSKISIQYVPDAFSLKVAIIERLSRGINHVLHYILIDGIDELLCCPNGTGILLNTLGILYSFLKLDNPISQSIKQVALVSTRILDNTPLFGLTIV